MRSKVNLQTFLLSSIPSLFSNLTVVIDEGEDFYFEKEYPLDCEQILQEIPDFTEQPDILFEAAADPTETTNGRNGAKEDGLSYKDSYY